MPRRTIFLPVVLSLILALPSNLNVAFADSRRPVTVDVCHDGVWGLAEFCGRDAYFTTGVPDMNHDCVVDGVDVGLFIEQFGLSGSGISADLDASGIVDEMDVLLFSPRYGDHTMECLGQTPSTCQGTIALSFDPNPANIDPTENQTPGTHTVYVVIDGYTDASYVEYAIHNSPNIIITGNTLLVSGGNGLPSCNTGAFNDVVAAVPALASGPVAIAEIEYELLDTNPATLTLKKGNCPWSRVRWVKAAANVSYDFSNVFSAGINSPAPSPEPCSAPTNSPIGTASGKVFVDYDEDCSFDVGTDTPKDHAVRLDPGPYIAVPNGAGEYTFHVPAGSYTASLYAQAADPTLIQPCQNYTHAVNVPPNGAATGADFAVAPRATINGRIYRDIISDFCVYHHGTDHPLMNRRIEANPGGYSAITDHIGNYDLLVPPGEYTINIVPITNDPYVHEFCQVPSYTEDVQDGDVLPGRDVALHQAGPSHCGAILTIIPHGYANGPPPCNTPGRIIRRPCPGVEYEYIFLVSIDPLSTYASPAVGSTLAITLDPSFVINSVTSIFPITVVSSTSNGRTVQFDDNLWPGQAAAVRVRATPYSGGPYDAHAEFDNGGTCGGLLVADHADVSNCGCDPNQLAVQPEGCGEDHEIIGDEPMIYTIDFENVGPGPAHDIRIEHQLDSDLEMSSLRVVASSHAVTAVQLDPGNLVAIRLDGIELPGTFGPGSTKGFVVVMVDPLANLPDGTIIESSAAITFDFNDPVITNTVSNMIMANPCPVTGVGGDDVPHSTYLGANHPNPFNPTTTIDYGLASAQHVTISIYNVRGELVRSLLREARPAGRYSVDWNGRDDAGNLAASGVYMSRMDAGSFSEVRKLVLLK